MARAREELGYSQTVLASVAGLSQAALSHIEAGTRTPSIQNASAIALALGVSVGALLGEPDAALSYDERAFLTAWRAAPLDVRHTVTRFLQFCLADVAPSPSTPHPRRKPE